MTDRAEQQRAEFVTFQPWRFRIGIAVVFFVLMMVAFTLVPDGPYLLTNGPIFFVGFLAYSFAVNRSVGMWLEDDAVEIRHGWRKARIPYEQITGVAIGPDIGWRQQLGRHTLGPGVTSYLVVGTSVRLQTGETSVVVSAQEPYRVVGAIQRRRDHTPARHSADTEQSGS